MSTLTEILNKRGHIKGDRDYSKSSKQSMDDYLHNVDYCVCCMAGFNVIKFSIKIKYIKLNYILFGRAPCILSEFVRFVSVYNCYQINILKLFYFNL